MPILSKDLLITLLETLSSTQLKPLLPLETNFKNSLNLFYDAKVKILNSKKHLDVVNYFKQTPQRILDFPEYEKYLTEDEFNDIIDSFYPTVDFSYEKLSQPVNQKNAPLLNGTSSSNVLTNAINLTKLVPNYINRKWNQFFGDDEVSTNLLLPAINPNQNLQLVTNSEFSMLPQSYTGDTIKFKDNYILPESINLNDVTLGVRNRGDYTPINTEGAIITNFFEYLPYNLITNKDNKDFTYIGIDPSGKFKVGNIDLFNDGDLLSRTFENDVTDFVKDTNGNLVFKTARDNAPRQVPVITTADGRLGSLNFLTGKNNTSGTYGNITGGRIIMQAGNETRLVSGSIDDVEKLFNDLKLRHNVNSVKFYTLDNGTYNTGLRTQNLVLTSELLRDYDMRNSGGGNFMYLKSLVPNNSGYNLLLSNKNSVVINSGASLNDTTAITIRPDGTILFPNNFNNSLLNVQFLTNADTINDTLINSAVNYLKPILRNNNIPFENVIGNKYNNVDSLNFNKFKNNLFENLYYKKL